MFCSWKRFVCADYFLQTNVLASPASQGGWIAPAGQPKNEARVCDPQRLGRVKRFGPTRGVPVSGRVAAHRAALLTGISNRINVPFSLEMIPEIRGWFNRTD
jgi:hypothetical protein